MDLMCYESTGQLTSRFNTLEQTHLRNLRSNTIAGGTIVIAVQQSIIIIVFSDVDKTKRLKIMFHILFKVRIKFCAYVKATKGGTIANVEDEHL